MWRFTAGGTVVCVVVVVVLELTVGWLVPFLFGTAFVGAIPVSRVLLIAGLFISLRRILSDVSRGINMPGASSIAELVSLVLLIPTLLLCVQFGLLAVSWGFTIGSAVSLVVILWLVVRETRRRTRAHHTIQVAQVNS
jgi:O-antigen/teichoic acid export membrane protein